MQHVRCGSERQVTREENSKQGWSVSVCGEIRMSRVAGQTEHDFLLLPVSPFS